MKKNHGSHSFRSKSIKLISMLNLIEFVHCLMYLISPPSILLSLFHFLWWNVKTMGKKAILKSEILLTERVFQWHLSCAHYFSSVHVILLSFLAWERTQRTEWKEKTMQTNETHSPIPHSTSSPRCTKHWPFLLPAKALGIYSKYFIQPCRAHS